MDQQLGRRMSQADFGHLLEEVLRARMALVPDSPSVISDGYSTGDVAIILDAVVRILESSKAGRFGTLPS